MDTYDISSVTGLAGKYGSFAYDNRGNIHNNGQHGFTYNRANQMVSSGQNKYTYDGYNRRVKKVTGTGDSQVTEYGIKGVSVKLGERYSHRKIHGHPRFQVWQV